MAEADRPRQRIAILGGGIGSLSAAWALTSQPDWQQRYEITVWQQGWRLGGKGASSRNPALHHRIEEHGLHVWAGFYANAFRVIQEAFAELDRPAGSRLATWQDAFLRRDRVAVLDRMGDTPGLWFLHMPRNDLAPGQVGSLPTPGLLAQGLWGWVQELWAQLHDRHGDAPQAPPPAPPPSRRALLRTWRRLAAMMNRELLARAELAGPRPRWTPGEPDWPALFAQVQASPRHRRMVQQLAAIKGLPDAPVVALLQDRGVRHLFLLLDLAMAVMRGITADRLLTRGFRAVDDEEWLDWLARHGACALSLHAPVLACVYEYVFGFAAGDPARPALAAGTATHGILRLGFGYAGSIFWPMRGGMGETIFTPLYQALRQRGVRFEFFHRVEALHPTADGRRVGEIHLTRQARVRGEAYQPLVEVDGVHCWPEAPLFDQLVEGEALRDAALESGRGRPPAGQARVLQAGRDFDAVVLGIPVAELRRVAAPLAAAQPRWALMLDTVRTAATVALQLWLRPDAAGLGWTHAPGMASSMAWPYGSWADLSHTLAEEGWPAGAGPGSAAYFCGALAEPAPPTGADPMPDLLSQARAQAEHWLEHHARHLWPATTGPDGRFDWSVLADPLDRPGAARLDAQYVRANIDPSERYTLSEPGTMAARLAPDDSGYEGLVLAGDWTRTAINAGCIEAAVMSGLQAARGLDGRPRRIVGESWVEQGGLASALRARVQLRGVKARS